MVTGNELAGGIANPPLLRRRRHAVVAGWPPVFHLAEYDHAATSHHKVDLAASLAEMSEMLGPRPAAVARELTKLHEEVKCGTLGELAEEMKANRPKGEIVLVVGGKPRGDEEIDDAALNGMLRAELDGQRLRDAVKAVVEATGLPRNRVYRAALALDGDETDTS